MNIPKGWVITAGQMTINGVLSEVFQITNKRKNIRKTFISMSAIDKYFKELEYEKLEKQALAGKGAPSPAKGAILLATKDILAANEMEETL